MSQVLKIKLIKNENNVYLYKEKRQNIPFLKTLNLVFFHHPVYILYSIVYVFSFLTEPYHNKTEKKHS